jgi:ribosomal protein S18 acetylase RimI-like enzyme
MIQGFDVYFTDEKAKNINFAIKNRMKVLIRKAKKADIPAVYELVSELAVYEKAEKEFVAPLDLYYESFDNGLIHCVVAESDSKVIGMALYYLSFSTWKGRMMYLEDFVVKSEFRSHGVGQLLFEAFIEDAKKQKCTLVKWQVLDWNTPAIKFYERNKAIIEKEWWNGKIFLKG